MVKRWKKRKNERQEKEKKRDKERMTEERESERLNNPFKIKSIFFSRPIKNKTNVVLKNKKEHIFKWKYLVREE